MSESRILAEMIGSALAWEADQSVEPRSPGSGRRRHPSHRVAPTDTEGNSAHQTTGPEDESVR